jgi:hypothetical protein
MSAEPSTLRSTDGPRSPRINITRNAAITERIDAAGPITALKIRGRVEVLHGVFRPDLSVTGGAPGPDETITVVHR